MSGVTTCTDEEQRNVIQPTMVFQEGSPSIMPDEPTAEQRNMFHLTMAFEEKCPSLDDVTDSSPPSLMMRMAILLLSAAQLMTLVNSSLD